MSKRTHFHLVGAALAPATVLALGNAPALADRNHGAVKCGDTVTADTELAGDLIDARATGS